MTQTVAMEITHQEKLGHRSDVDHKAGTSLSLHRHKNVLYMPSGKMENQLSGVFSYYHEASAALVPLSNSHCQATMFEACSAVFSLYY